MGNFIMRALILINVLVLLLSVLSGCSNYSAGSVNDDKDFDTLSESVEESESLSSTIGNFVTLKWVYDGPGPQKDEKAVVDEVNKYLKNKINAKVELYCIPWDQFISKRDMMIAAGENLDIVMTSSWSGYPSNVAKGSYLDITELARKYAPKTLSQLNSIYITAATINGKLFAIPCNKDLTQIRVLKFNKNLVDKYRFDISSIKSIADVEPMLKIIKENEVGVTPIFGSAPHHSILAGIVQDCGVPYVGVMKENGKLKCINGWSLPQAMKAFKLAHKWYKSGYTNKDILTYSGNPNDIVRLGKVFCWETSGKPGGDKEDSGNLGLDIIQVPLTKPIASTGDATGSMMSIARTSKNPERALMFLELVNTDKYLNNLLNYGIENRHYKKVSDNVIEKIRDSGYNPGIQWIIGNQFLNYLFSNEDENKWVRLQEFNNSVEPAWALGFTFDASKVNNEIAACDQIRNTFERSIIFGVSDPEKDLPKYLEKLKAAGWDRICSEAQTQIDGYMD